MKPDVIRALIDGPMGLSRAAKNIAKARAHGITEFMAGWEHLTIEQAATALRELLAEVERKTEALEVIDRNVSHGKPRKAEK